MQNFPFPLEQVSAADMKRLMLSMIERPDRWYNLVPLLADANGNLYYTDNPLLLLERDNSAPFALTILTKTPALKSVSISHHIAAVKDFLNILPVKYDTVLVDDYDDDTGEVIGKREMKLPKAQYIRLFDSRFGQQTNMVQGDVFIPTITVKFTENDLL